MNKRSLVLLTAICCLSPLTTHQASAKRMGGVVQHSSTTTTIKGTNGKEVNASTLLTITEVGSDSITVKGSEAAKSYKIDGKTKIYIKGNLASLKFLKKGMQVTVDASSLQPTLAISITAS